MPKQNNKTAKRQRALELVEKRISGWQPTTGALTVQAKDLSEDQLERKLSQAKAEKDNLEAKLSGYHAA